MAEIRIRQTGEQISAEDAVRSFLTHNQVYYAKWDVTKLPNALQGKFNLSDDDKNTILAELDQDIKSLSTERGYVKWDVIALSEQTPDLDSLLKKFEQVHTHSEDEVRAIVAGSGTFVVKGQDGGYFDIRLQAGDVISVPEGNPHFFTLTEERRVVAVRLFVDPAGWVATPYGDSID